MLTERKQKKKIKTRRIRVIEEDVLSDYWPVKRSKPRMYSEWTSFVNLAPPKGDAMAQVLIREATSSDIPVLLRHRRMMWWDMGRRDETALDMMEKAATEYFSHAVPEGSYRGFLAIDTSTEVIGGGGIVISPWPGVLGQLQPKRAMILNLYVEWEHRRQGVAKALMKRMIAWCRQNEFCSVALHASEDGRALYERLGFKPTNEMRLEFDMSANVNGD